MLKFVMRKITNCYIISTSERERFVKYNIDAKQRINEDRGIGSTYKLTTEEELYNKFDLMVSQETNQILAPWMNK